MDNPLSSPDVLIRHSLRGEPLSRRETEKAIKEEKQQQRRDDADAEKKRIRRESLDTRKRSVDAMEESNKHTQKASRTT